MRVDENLEHNVLIRFNPEQMQALDLFARNEASSRSRIIRLAVQTGLTVMNAERDAYRAFCALSGVESPAAREEPQ